MKKVNWARQSHEQFEREWNSLNRVDLPLNSANAYFWFKAGVQFARKKTAKDRRAALMKGTE